VYTDANLAEVMGALAAESRVRILRLLQRKALACRAEAGCDLSAHCCHVTELAAALNVSLPTVSHHLRELRRAGLIRMVRRGRFREVTLAPAALLRLAATLQALATHGASTTEKPNGSSHDVA